MTSIRTGTPATRSRPRSRAEIPGHIVVVARALFGSEGYERVTMEQIAGEAAVSKRTLYKYFPVKEALLERLLEAELAEDLARRDVCVDPQAGFRAVVATLLQESARWCEQHAKHLLPYIRYKFATFDPRATVAKDQGLLPVWTAWIAAAQGRGELRADCPAEQLGIYFHYLYLGALMRWLTDSRLDLREEFGTVVALFTEGAAAKRA